MIPLLVYLGMRLKEVVSPWLAANVRRPKLLRAGLLIVLFLGIGAELTESYFRYVVQTDNALLQASNFAMAHIPTNDTVLADEPVGVMIPQQYCKLESAATCPDVKWIIAYTSLTEHLPTQASDPQLYVLMGESQVVTVIHGFKETITVYHVGTSDTQTQGTQSTIPVPVVPTPVVTAVPTVVPTAVPVVPTATPVVPTATPLVPTATPVVPTATPVPSPT
jgi:hypothetical protein